MVGLHLPLGWFASSAWVVCSFRLGGLQLPLGWFASPLGWFASPAMWLCGPTTPQHTDPHPCTSPPLGGHEGTWGTRVFYSAPVFSFTSHVFQSSHKLKE